MGLVWWIVAWAFGIKAVDAFIVTVFLVIVAAAYMLLRPFLDRLLGRESASLEERGAGGF